MSPGILLQSCNTLNIRIKKTFFTFFFAIIVSAGLFAQTTLSIFEIQGQAASSPYEGQEVETTGIVTGVSYNGYYIQDGPGAWNGVFVNDDDNLPIMGDELIVIGEVQEFNDMTRLGNISSFNIESEGNQLPDIATISALETAMEDYEGVLVRVENIEVTLLPDQYGVWRGYDVNGIPVVIDNDIYTYTPNLGDHLNISGCIMYGIGEFKINPRMADDITPWSIINDYRNNLVVLFYPNPANDYLVVIADEPISSVVIYSLNGNKVQEYKGLFENSARIDISEIVQGIYMIEVYSAENKSLGQKVVVR